MKMEEKPFDSRCLVEYLGSSTRNIAELLGVRHQTVHRWSQGVMFSEAEAEHFAHKLHAHPCEIWKNWFAEAPS